MHRQAAMAIQGLFPSGVLCTKPAKGMESHHRTLGLAEDSGGLMKGDGIFTTGCTFETKGRGSSRAGNCSPAAKGKVKELLNIIEDDLIKQNKTTKEQFLHMRASFLKGGGTKAHVDNLRGCTATHYMITRENACATFMLCAHLFPSFKCSLVVYKGEVYLPMSCDSNIGLAMIGQDKDNHLHAKWHLFDKKIVHNLMPYGDLSVACVGLRKGLLRVFPLGKSGEEIESNKELPKARFRDLVATCKRKQDLPKRKWKFISRPQVWHSFSSLRHRHWLGNW